MRMTLRLALPLPAWLASWLFPRLYERASLTGSASHSVGGQNASVQVTLSDG